MDKDNLDSEIERLMQEALNEKEEFEKEESSGDNNDNEDNNVSKENDGNNENSENSEENNNNNPSEEEEEEEKKNSDENESGKRQSSDFEEIEVNIDGQKVKIESKDELESFLKKNTVKESTKKSIAEEYFNQANLSEEDLRLLADIKAGKPGALKTLADKSKIDLADADEFDGEYKPEFEAKIKTDVELVIDNIASNEPLAKTFGEIAKTLPDDFLTSITANAEDLKTFASHVESGLAAELLPLAAKESLKGGSLLENYIKLGEAKALKSNTKKTETSDKDTKQTRDISDKEKSLRDRASADADENKGGKSSDMTVDEMWESDILEKVKSGEVNLRDLD